MYLFKKIFNFIFITISLFAFMLAVWFYFYKLDITAVSNPLIDFALNKIGITKAEYNAIKLNKNEFHLNRFKSSDISFESLNLKYNIFSNSTKLTKILLKNATIFFENLDKNGITRPILIKTNNNDKGPPLSPKHIINLIPNEVILDNVKINFLFEKLNGTVQINAKINKNNRQIIMESKFNGHINLPKQDFLNSVSRIDFELSLNSKLQNNIIIIEDSFLKLSSQDTTIRINSETDLLVKSIQIDNFNTMFDIENNIIKNLKIKMAPTSLSLKNKNDWDHLDVGNIDIALKEMQFQRPKDNIIDFDLSIDHISSEKRKLSIEQFITKITGHFDNPKINSSLGKVKWSQKKNNKLIVTPLEVKIKVKKTDNLLDITSTTNFIKNDKIALNTHTNYNLETKKGQLKFQSSHIDLDQNRFSIKNLSPFLSEENLQIYGTLFLSGFYPIQEISKSNNFSFSLSNLSFKYNEIELNNLNSKGQLFNLKRPKTNQEQFVKISHVKVGHSIEDISFFWSLIDHNLKLRDFKGKVFSGDIHIDHISTDISSKKFKPFTINLQQLDLQKVLALALKDDLYAKGKLSGSIKLQMNDKGIFSLKGKLNSITSGVIKYDSSPADQIGSRTNQSAGILFRYLKNMHYKNLNINLETDEKYNLSVLLNLYGRNPSLRKIETDTVDLDGKPLKLKLNLDLNILKAIKSYLLAFNLPKDIEKKLIETLKKR